MTTEERPGDELLRLKEAAERLNVKVKMLRNWIALRKIGHVRLGRAIRIPASDISGIIEDGYRPHADEPPPLRRPQAPAKPQPTKALPVDSVLPVDSELSAESELWVPTFEDPNMDPRVKEALVTCPNMDPGMMKAGLALLDRYRRECGPEPPLRGRGSHGPDRFHLWVTREAYRLERMRQQSLETWINGLEAGLFVVKGRNVKIVVVKE